MDDANMGGMTGTWMVGPSLKETSADWRILMKFKKAKGRALHMGRNSLITLSCKAAWWRRTLGCWWTTSSTWAMPTCSKKGQQHPGLHQQQCCQWSWGMILFLCTAEATSWVSQYERDTTLLELVQFRPQRWLRDSPVSRKWVSWDCSARRREGSGRGF